MEDWMSTILWVTMGVVLLLILRIYRSVLDDIPSTHPETPIIFYRTLQGLIGIIALSSALLSSPLPTEGNWSPANISTVCIAIWWAWTLWNNSRLEEDDNNPITTIGLATVIAGYMTAIAWNQLPAPLKFVIWFRDLPTELQSLTAIVVGVISAIIVHQVVLPITSRLTRKTDTDLDDTLLELIRWPSSVSIGLIGVGHAINSSLLSDFWVRGFHGLSLSVLIAMWTHVALKSSSILLEHMLESSNHWLVVNERTLPIFHLLLRIVIITMSVYLLLLAWDIDVMLWITSAGVIGIAVAYASQDTLASLFAGVAILSDAPYKLHDYLVLDDQTKGRVTHIGFRSTRLLTTENIEVIIPNSIMANAQIINMSGGETSIARIEIAAGVAYGSDVEQIRTLLLDIAKKLDNVILDKPQLEPVAHFTSMGASSLDFTLRLWIEHPERLLKIQDQANTLIYTTFTEHGIEIPYTKQDVYLYSMGTPTS